MRKKQQKRKFNSMFYVGLSIILSPIIATILVLGVSKCSSNISDSKKTIKKDSVKIVTKTVTVHDTVKIVIEKPKKKKKVSEDTLSNKEIINTVKKDSI